MKTSYETIRIVLADDHEILRRGFRSIVENEPLVDLVAVAVDGYDLINMVRQHRPDVVLTDIRMPDMDGVEVVRRIRAEYPATGIIAFSMFDDDHLVMDMLGAGALGYVLKGCNKHELLEALRMVHKGHCYFSRPVSAKLHRLEAAGLWDPVLRVLKPAISEREADVLNLMCQEYSTLEIGKALGISDRTVEVHRQNLLRKSNRKNSNGLMLWAVKHGFWKLDT